MVVVYPTTLTLTSRLSSPSIIPLGYADTTSVYIKDNSGKWQEFTSYDYFKIVKKQNQVSQFEIKIYDIQDEEKAYVKEFAEILFFSEHNLILKGRIQKITYETSYSCTATGYGMESKLLDKELIKSGDKRVQYNNASAQTIAKELLSENTDGTSPWIIQPSSGGLFSSDYGNITLRFEYANRLKALAKLAEAINYEWSVTQDSEYNDYFNIDELLPNSTRATTPQETFTITGANANCYLTSKEKDISNMANKVDVLGYGDGINQLHTSTYNASSVYSTLASDVSDTDTTIPLADASSFPSSGEIRIAEERITYAGKSGNNLIGCTRGANGTTARAHKKGVYVEKFVDINSAEAGSSIGEYGLLDYTVTDKGLIDLETAELIASKILLKRMDPIVRIKIMPNEPFDVIGSLQIGDLITINDDESGISGNYRVVGMTYESNYGDISLEIEASNVSLTFIEQMQKAKEEQESLQKYMQGATNIYAISTYENCDSSHPVNLRFYIPNEAVSINKVKLNFKMKKYRAYSSTTDNTGNHTHTVTGQTAQYSGAHTHSVTGTTTSQESQERTSSSVADYPGHVIHYGTGTTIYWPNEISTSTKYSVCYCWLIFEALSTTDFRIKAFVEQYNNGNWNGISDYMEHEYNLNSGDYSYFGVWIPLQPGTGTKYRVRYRIDYIAGESGSLIDRGNGFILGGIHTHTVSGQTAQSSGAHTHSVTGTTTDSQGAHSHSINYAISEQSLSSPSVTIKVGPDGGSLTTVGTYTADETDLDITNIIRSVGAGNWAVIEFTPNQNMRIEANAYIQIFIESK